MVEVKLFGWCFPLFFYLSRFVSIHHDLLFVLLFIFVFVFRILIRSVCNFYYKKCQRIVPVPIMEISWTVSTCVFCLYIYLDGFVEPAECAGQDEQPLDLEFRLGLPGPEIEVVCFAYESISLSCLLTYRGASSSRLHSLGGF